MKIKNFNKTFCHNAYNKLELKRLNNEEKIWRKIKKSGQRGTICVQDLVDQSRGTIFMRHLSIYLRKMCSWNVNYVLKEGSEMRVKPFLNTFAWGGVRISLWSRTPMCSRCSRSHRGTICLHEKICLNGCNFIQWS